MKADACLQKGDKLLLFGRHYPVSHSIAHFFALYTLALWEVRLVHTFSA